MSEIKPCPRLSELPPPPENKSGWPWTEESEQLSASPSWPRVSIVTPSFNQGQYLEETIRSVLLQGYPDLEYIILDGGSSDGSVDIIRKYEPWLSYWVSQLDQGQTHAINDGWAKATGKILAYINSDDCYMKGAVPAAVKGFDGNPSVGMVYGTAIVVDETGQQLRTWKSSPFDVKVMLTKGSIVPQPAAFFSSEVLKKVGYLDEQWNMIMDYELCIRIGLQFPTVCLPLPLARFRDHSQSKTNLQFEKTASELIRFLSSFFPEQVPVQELLAMKREAMSRIRYEWALACLAQSNEKPANAFRQLLMGVTQYPFYAMKHPVSTTYITKEVVLGYLRKKPDFIR